MANKKNNKTNKVKPVSKKPKGGEKNANKPSHPRSSEMVIEAIAALKEKKGSSLQAIKKYIKTTYRIDVAKQSTHIKKYIKSAVENNKLVRTKGTGASGRFRLPTVADLLREKQKNMPKKPPSNKQAPGKLSNSTKKNDARKKSGRKLKNSVDKKGGNPNGLKRRKSAAPKNSKK